jgi:hypothetical protein
MPPPANPHPQDMQQVVDQLNRLNLITNSDGHVDAKKMAELQAEAADHDKFDKITVRISLLGLCLGLLPVILYFTLWFWRVSENKIIDEKAFFSKTFIRFLRFPLYIAIPVALFAMSCLRK